MLKYWLLTMAVAFGLMAAPAAQAEISDGVIKLGVLTDMSSLYADLSGQGSVIAARMAVEDFGAAKKGMKVEIISADHQNKADVAASIARQWFDVDGVDMITDLNNSAVALAVNEIARDSSAPGARMAVETAVSLIQPAAPHVAEELWGRLGHSELWKEPWPVAKAGSVVTGE